MRTLAAALLILALPGAAVAQTPNSAAPPVEEIQRELANPATAEMLSRMLGGMSEALLNLPVGEIQAAAEGRSASPVEKRMTVRDIGRRDDPQFDRNLREQVANGGETMKVGMRAMAAALPAMMDGMRKAAEELDKATANLPSPTYPKR